MKTNVRALALHIRSSSLPTTPTDEKRANKLIELKRKLSKSNAREKILTFETSKSLYDHIEEITMNHIIINPTLSKHFETINDSLSQLKIILFPETPETSEDKQDDYAGGDTPIEPQPMEMPDTTEFHLQKSEKNSKLSDINIYAESNTSNPSFSNDNKSDFQYNTMSNRLAKGISLHAHDLAKDPEYSINSTLCGGQLHGSMRQDWNTIELPGEDAANWEELKPSWYELFFDLMFVAAIVHISSEVAHAYEHLSTSYMFILSVFPQFGLLLLCWMQNVQYQSRFRMIQTSDGFIHFIYMVFILLMGLAIEESETAHKAFLVSYVFGKLTTLLMFSKSHLIPRAVNHSRFMMLECVVSITVCIVILIFVNIDDDVDADGHDGAVSKAYFMIFTCLFLYSFTHITFIQYCDCVRHLGVNIPLNVPHMAERMGEFVLIILGETIISIMIQHIGSKSSSMLIAYSVTICFFIIVFAVGKCYFESQPSEHELFQIKKSHALSTSKWRSIVYESAHMLLFFGLLGLGLGSKIITHELAHYHGGLLLISIPGISCVVICVCINVIRLTHPFDYGKSKNSMVYRVWGLRFFCLAIMLLVLLAHHSINHIWILLIYDLCFLIQMGIEFEATHRVSLHHTMEMREVTNQRCVRGDTINFEATLRTQTALDMIQESK